MNAPHLCRFSMRFIRMGDAIVQGKRKDGATRRYDGFVEFRRIGKYKMERR
jgi:hypothetical protein